MQAKACVLRVGLVLFSILASISSIRAEIRVMPLGDSITRGGSSGVVDPDFFVSYRKALYDSLKAAGYEPDFVGSLTDGSATPDFDPNHEGHGGWRTDQIAANVFNWLITNPANIVLLHIGTNDISGNNEDPMEVDDILQEIDRYETVFGKNVWVILAYIVNRGCDPYLPPCLNSQETTIFNSGVKTLVAEPRISSGDKIITADMEIGAGIDYRRQPVGDMWDDVHPFETGYAKMSDAYFSALLTILPVATAGPDQSANEFNTITLDGTDSADPKGGVLSYLWEQTAGTVVVLSDEQSAQPTFVAPDVGSISETLTFKLTVVDEDGLESADTTSVTVVEEGLPLFTDVIPGFWAEDYIYAIFSAGITTGCYSDPLLYCPYDLVNRAQMAAFIVRAVEGEPPADYCETGSPFSDVPSTHPMCKYIKRLSELGITTGYSDGTYRPTLSVNRAQMAAFIVRAVEGEPPADYCETGSPFTDIDSNLPMCKYIKRLFELGITTGYSDGTYRPTLFVNRTQMAAFLARAFLGME